MLKKERFTLQLDRHVRALCDLYRESTGEDLNYFDGVKVSRSLRRIEGKISRLAEKYCNGDIDGDEFDRASERYKCRVLSLFGGKIDGFFINSDPRGYALKIKSEVKTGANLFQDWGGYKLLAPELPC